MRLALIPFLQTVSATAALASGLFFFRFWRESHDRLFAFFGAAFWVLALSWALLALVNPSDEARPVHLRDPARRLPAHDRRNGR